LIVSLSLSCTVPLIDKHATHSSVNQSHYCILNSPGGRTLLGVLLCID